jgi:hypothetical protein
MGGSSGTGAGVGVAAGCAAGGAAGGLCCGACCAKERCVNENSRASDNNIDLNMFGLLDYELRLTAGSAYNLRVSQDGLQNIPI